jgi:hypothetical protein
VNRISNSERVEGLNYKFGGLRVELQIEFENQGLNGISVERSGLRVEFE